MLGTPKSDHLICARSLMRYIWRQWSIRNSIFMFAFNSVSHYKYVPLFPELKKNLLQKGEVCMRTGFLWGPCPILAVTSWRRFEAKRSQERRINFSLDLQFVHFFISLLLRYEMLPHTHMVFMMEVFQLIFVKWSLEWLSTNCLSGWSGVWLILSKFKAKQIGI